MRPFNPWETLHRAKRTVNRYRTRRKQRQARQRDSAHHNQTKKALKCSLLNINGLSETSLANVDSVIDTHSPDVVILLETKRRVEETGIDIAVPGYSVLETKRSNNAGDRDGGGIAIYTKLSDGIIFKHHKPIIANPANAFVNSERLWITVESESSKTAICGLYLGCQYNDDRYAEWNDAIYQTVQQEAFNLRSKGFRIVYLGDFNGHIGNVPMRGGIPGNTAGVNQNGHRLLNFIANTDSVNVNAMCRVPGDWSTRVCDGLWTRQRGGISSIIDYALISREHASTVMSMYVDDRGSLGGGSDHNWIMFNIADRFTTKKRLTSIAVKKDRWDISENQDWSLYRSHLKDSAVNIVSQNIDSLASHISTSILKALHST